MASRAPASLRARAWMLDAFFYLNLHPHLVNTNNGDIAHEYVRKVFHDSQVKVSQGKVFVTEEQFCLFPFSRFPLTLQSLLPQAAVPLVARTP